MIPQFCYCSRLINCLSHRYCLVDQSAHCLLYTQAQPVLNMMGRRVCLHKSPFSVRHTGQHIINPQSFERRGISSKFRRHILDLNFMVALGKSRFICYNNLIIKRPFPISLPLSHHLSEHQFRPYHLQSMALALILLQTHVENTKNEVTITRKMVGVGGSVSM